MVAELALAGAGPDSSSLRHEQGVPALSIPDPMPQDRFPPTDPPLPEPTPEPPVPEPLDPPLPPAPEPVGVEPERALAFQAQSPHRTTPRHS